MSNERFKKMLMFFKARGNAKLLKTSQITFAKIDHALTEMKKKKFFSSCREYRLISRNDELTRRRKN